MVCTYNHSVLVELVSIGLTLVEAQEAMAAGRTVADYSLSLTGQVSRFVSDGSPVIRAPVGFSSTSSGVFTEIEDDRSYNPAGFDPDATPLPGYDDHGWPTSETVLPDDGGAGADANGQEVDVNGKEIAANGKEIAAGDGGRWGLAALVVAAVLAMAKRK